MPVMCHIRARCFRWSLGLLECGAGGIANGIRKRPLPRPLALMLRTGWVVVRRITWVSPSVG